jgi:stage II sporulation protein D
MEKWGDDYSTYLAKIMSAVSETDGLYLSYDSQPALAVFHSSSAGQTEDSSAVWGTSLPYLVSVETPEDESSVPNYISSVTISAEEFMDFFPNSDFTEDISSWMENPIYDESGRLSSVTIGGTTVSGTDLRKLFSLRSTAITFNVNDNEIVLTCTGYGHGVGMSQYGANALSKLGYTFEEILENYYPGTVLSKTYDLSAEIKNQTIG